MPVKEDEKPDMEEVVAMHESWCEHSGHDDFGPCLMWQSGPGKKSEL